MSDSNGSQDTSSNTMQDPWEVWMTAMIVWTIRQTQGPLRGKNGSDYSPNPGPLRGKNGSYDSTTPGPLRGKNGSYDSPTPGPLRVIVPLKIPYFYRNDEVLRNPIFYICWPCTGYRVMDSPKTLQIFWHVSIYTECRKADSDPLTKTWF